MRVNIAMKMKHYDFIFAGGGLAGLSLAYHLAHSPLRDRSILIVDRDPKDRNDRTWCFWTRRPTLFDAIVQREWSQIDFVGEGFARRIGLGDYRYKMIRGLDFYRHVRQEMGARPNIVFAQGHVERVEDSAEGAQVWIAGEPVSAAWVFDSRFDAKNFVPNPARCRCLTQHFKGWEIETASDAFEPTAATLLDFRTPQKNATRFFYVLSFSRRRALIEYVTTRADRYDDALEEYIKKGLGIGDYKIVATEGGVNPMSAYVFPRRAGARIMNIGTRGGQIKPSTGYAFLRIQQDSAAIVQSLLTRGHPFDVPAPSRRYRLYDTLMLDVMQRHGDQIESLFSALFKSNPIARVLRFLDEEGTLAENAQLIASLPPQLFLQALFRKRGF
ncbi:MAG: Lycopene cyclase [Chloroflexi bacterium]|nr:Lycopene cyclase [Chloroflexota bacterium]